MLDRHTGYIDIISVLIRLRHHTPLSRAQILRALIEFMQQSGIDFSQFASMDQMVAYLVEYLKKIPNLGHRPLLLESSLFLPQAAANREIASLPGQL